MTVWRQAWATLCLAGAAVAAGATPGYRFPSYARAAQVQADCRDYLAEMRREERRLQALPEAELPTLLPALDAMMRRYEDVVGPMGVLVAVHPDKAIRDAADACDAGHQDFLGRFQQNPRIHARLKRVQPADDIDRGFLAAQLEAFEDSGVGLGAKQRQRAQAINSRLTKLAQQFDRRIREDDTWLAFSADELAGVPEAAWALVPRDAQGRARIGVDAPSYDAVIHNARDPLTRERIWRALHRVGGRANLRTLGDLAALRAEYARLFGFDSYADFALRRRMAGDAATVRGLLDRVQAAVTPREEADLALLREIKARDLGTRPEATDVHRWDTDFYTQRLLRERFQLDQEQFRRYFPPDASLAFVFAIAQQLFGVRIEAEPQPLWHDDARAFAVREAATGEPLGTLFADLYPRPDKYNHAAVWSFRSSSTLAARKPAAALVVNFNRNGLTLRELETLLHEFGHAMHALLSTTRYASQGGTSTRLDFSEAPSQMLEDWVYDPAVLALFQQVCARCTPVPPELLARAAEARHLAKGIRFGRQLLLGRYDLTLHGAERVDVLDTWLRLEAATPLGSPAGGDWLPAGFSHIASGYSAGYYAYMWSLVLAEDLRTPFVSADGTPDRLNAAVGRRYRETVLSQGGQAEPAVLMRNFLGRDTDSRAFFQSLQR